MREIGPRMLTFAVLGEIRAWRAGTELDLGSRQQRALLAALLLRPGRAATVDELIDDVWGENPTASAVGALRNHILHLRRVLEPGRAAGAPPRVLVALGGGYALRLPPGCVDIEQVDALLRDPEADQDAVVDAALRCWTGTPLAGLPGPFAERQRAHLADRRVVLLEQRADLDLRHGRYAEAVAALTPLCAEHTLRERPRGLLMTALYHAGRQAEALRVYADTRRELVDQLGIEPGPDLTELHRRILAGDLGAAHEPAARPVVPQRVAQLPADVVDFTGRAEVADLLATRLTAAGTGVPVCAIGGMGGIGKSALAVHVAHRVRAHFPDGQLHVDLHGFAADRANGAANAADTLGDFLRVLGVPEGELAAGAAERAAQFRSLLDGKRVLVVLDNARSAEQIAPLIPGTPGSAVLVTSRSALPELPGTTAVRLDVLTAAEAHSLLAGIAGADRIAAEPDAVAAVLGACGGLPLAVRIVGARLAARPAWTVGLLADRLRDTAQRLSVLRTGELAVELAFRISYDQLDTGHARAFRMLAAPEVGELCAEGAAAILELDLRQAEQVCEDLVDLHLLETTAPGRYTYHDLLRLFARELPGAADPPVTALRRLLDFYLATVKHAVAVCNPGTRLPEHLLATVAGGMRFADEHAAQAWLAGQRHSLVSLYRQCAQVGGPVLAPAADIAWATAELIDGGAHCHEVARALEELLDAAVRAGDRSVECRVRVALGALFAYSLGALRQGRDHQRIALSLDRGTISDARLTAFAAQLLSSSTRRGTETAAPLAHSARAIRLARQVGDRAVECACLVHEVKTLSDAGDFPAARARALTARALAAELGNRSLEVMATHELGVTLVYQGETAAGVRLCEEAVALGRAGGIELRLGWALSRLAHVLLMAGRAPEAEPVADEAICVLTRAIGPLTRARVLVLRGLIKQTVGKQDEAEESFVAAAETFATMQDPHLTHERLDAELEAPILAVLHEHLAAVRARRGVMAAS
ncbi:BTAD domain-containing putative transcriptional regulator [Nocardia asteroides]